MTASATDPNGDSITYDWQEYDLGAWHNGGSQYGCRWRGQANLSPLSSNGRRNQDVPSMQYILNNANVPPTFTGGFLTGELLPAISRAMTFQVVARDNRANGGGINSATATVTIDGTAAPFAVTSPIPPLVSSG